MDDCAWNNVRKAHVIIYQRQFDLYILCHRHELKKKQFSLNLSLLDRLFDIIQSLRIQSIELLKCMRMTKVRIERDSNHRSKMFYNL